VAAEEWSAALLTALPEITAACLNALLLAMIQAGAPSMLPQLPPPPPIMPPPREQQLTSPKPFQASSVTDLQPSLSQTAVEVIGLLKRHFGNRATELLGVMTSSAASQPSKSITKSARKRSHLMSEDLQVSLKCAVVCETPLFLLLNVLG
jgi:hypothetical protein